MWRCEHSVVVKAPKTVVWALWTDVASWPKWDTDLSEAALHGELEAGAEGKMKVADDALVSFTIHELVPEERLVTRTKMFGAKLDIVHEMTEEEGGVRVTHRAELKGLFSWLWRWFVAGKIKRTLASALDNFAKLAAQTPPPAPAEGEQVAEKTNESTDKAAAPATEQPTQEEQQTQGTPPEGQEGDTKEGEDASEEPVLEGIPEENEVRKKDMQEQIEQAAKAEVPHPEKPEQLIVESEQDELLVAQPASETAAITQSVTPEIANMDPEQEEDASLADTQGEQASVPNDAPVVAISSSSVEEPKKKR